MQTFPVIIYYFKWYICLSEKAIEQLSHILGVEKEDIFNEEMEGVKSLNNLINHLFNHFAENKKLLLEAELNQKKLQEELKLLHSTLIEKTPSAV